MNLLDRYKELGEIPKEIDLKPTLRVNTLKLSNEELVKKLKLRKVKLKKILELKNGYTIINTPFSLGASLEYLMGYCSLQEQAAQYAVEILNPTPKDIVLDMCAAPGGKTTQIAQWMNNQGTIIALDPIRRRLKVLHNHLERCAVTNTTCYNIDGRQIDELNIQFDKILVDAPCSGNFITDKDWLKKRDLEGIKARARLQKQLLVSAINVLKPGGTIVYSTCSLEPEENELVLDWILKEFPEIKLQKISTPGDPGLTEVFGTKLNAQIKNARRFWPWKTNTQGFFVAKLKK
ncbi:MAG: NOL1/NOP2/sun family putative RNA methylase [Candidatus Nanoarchaeia archaeon]